MKMRKDENEKYKIVSFSCLPSTQEEMKRQAKILGISLSKLICICFREWMKNEGDK